MTTSQPVQLFESTRVRSHWDAAQEKWYFSVVDVVQVLTDSTIPKRYWSDLRRKLEKESGQPYEEIVRLKMPAADGRLRETDAADVPTLLRLIQSIPSPKACNKTPKRAKKVAEWPNAPKTIWKNAQGRKW